MAEKTFFSGRLINQKYIYIYKGIFSCEHQTVPDYLAAAVHSEKKILLLAIIINRLELS